MKSTILVTACALAAHLAVAYGDGREDSVNILKAMDAEFNIEKLSSLHIRFRYEQTGKDGIAFEMLLVMESNKFYAVKQYDRMVEMDYTTAPPAVRTNYHPRALYEWCDGVYKVEGCSDSDASTQWVIKNAGENSWWGTIHDILYLKDWKESDAFRVIRKTITTNGVVYTCSAVSGSAPVAEFTYSSTDGNGIAPIRRVHLSPDGTKYDSEWTGWRKYGDIWIPSIYKNICYLKSCDSDGSITDSTAQETFMLLGVVSVNERISPRWFMPQFPACAVQIVDETESKSKKYNNYDYNGNPYQ